MTGIVELSLLLKDLKPDLLPGEWVFCSVLGDLEQYLALKPRASFKENEGLTLVLSRETADAAGLTYEGRFRQITISVHSSLDAVGLTAAMAKALTDAGVSANVVAAYYHDHIFVPVERAEDAMTALIELSRKNQTPSPQTKRFE